MKILVGNMSWLNNSANTPNKSSIPDLVLSNTLVSQKNSLEVVSMIQQLIADSETSIVLLPLEVDKWLELQKLVKQLYQKETQELETTLQQENEWIVELRAFILERLSDSDLNIDMIKKRFSLSRSTLYRKLKTYTALSVTEYIREVRLETAKKYLQMKNHSITEISYKTGFSSPSHFSRVFKKAYGKSPSEMR